MKKLKLFLVLVIGITLFSLVSVVLKANNPFCAGDSAYVTAWPGLKLRLSPEMNAEVITVLEYGQGVVIVEVLEDRPARIGWADGHWSRILFETVEGYVFNGYLSPLVVPSPRLNSHAMTLGGLLEEYALQQFAPVIGKDTVQYHRKADRHYHVKYSSTLDEGAELHVHVYFDREKAELGIPGIRIMDAYHLLRGMLLPYENGEDILGDLVFKEDRRGNIYEISSRTLERVQISSKKDGLITISVRDYVHTGS